MFAWRETSSEVHITDEVIGKARVSVFFMLVRIYFVSSRFKLGFGDKLQHE